MITWLCGPSWVAIVGEPPVAWTGPLSIDLAVTGKLLEIKYAALARRPARPEVLRGVIGEQTYRAIIHRERFAVFPAAARTHVTSLT
jgi:hypothetical protein